MSEEAVGQDTGAPPGGNETQKGSGEWKPPSDGSWLPKVRVDEMVNKAEGATARAVEDAARLRAENEALKAAKAESAAPKPLTRAELKALVDEGRITQEASDAAWDKQLREDTKREAREAARSEVEGRERESVVKRQLEEYRELIPAAWEANSKERQKAEREFKALFAMGFPDNKVTEVAALRAAFGDPEAIRASRSTGRTGPGEAHVEVGGGERPGETPDADGKPKGLTPRQDAHYTNLINRGIMKGWKEVTEELKFVRKRA